MTSPQVRLVGAAELRTEAALEPELDLARRAFGPFDARVAAVRVAMVRSAAADGRYLGVFDGPDLVGSALIHDMRQWWRGRSLPMAGIGGVKVAPEQRGRGVGRALMTGLLAEIGRRGYPLSLLYPATMPLYRSLGWELAGGYYQVSIPARSLRRLQPPELGAVGAGGGLRRAGPGDAEQVNEIIGRVYQESAACGPATFSAESVRAWMGGPDRFDYLAADGFASYSWRNGVSEISADCVLASSPQTTRALWSVIGSHGTIARTVRATVSPADPVTWLTVEQDVRLVRTESWMLRVADAPAAVAGRGFPAGACAAVRLRLDDPQLPANAGDWDLKIGGGTAVLQSAGAGAGDGAGVGNGLPGGPGPLRLGPRGFAALYAGVPMATLRVAGLAAGDGSADAALDDAFAAQPYLLDSF